MAQSEQGKIRCPVCDATSRTQGFGTEPFRRAAPRETPPTADAKTAKSRERKRANAARNRRKGR